MPVLLAAKALAARVPLAAWLALALLAAIALLLSHCAHAGREDAGAALAEEQSGAAIRSAADAVGTVGEVARRQQRTDSLTVENGNAIDNAPGAHDPVNPAVHDAGLDGLCRRAAYRGSEFCLQRAAP